MPTAKNTKAKEWFHATKLYNFDVLGFAETNINWAGVDQHERPIQYTKGWWENSFILASHNTNQPTARYQPGGVITTTYNGMTSRIFEKGEDSTNLARWNWIRFRGKHGTSLRIATLYRPVRAKGATSTYMQHQALFCSKGQDAEPRSRMMEDLGTEIDRWHEAGDTVILMGDWNEDTSSESFHKWLNSHGLHNLILSAVGKKLPNTVDNGSKPIDAIIGSVAITPTSGGYLAFDQGLASDHCMLWVDVPYRNVLGDVKQPKATFKARRLKTRDPRIVLRYNAMVHKALADNNVYNQVFKMEDNCTDFLTMEDERKLNEIVELRNKICDEAENKCRKIKAGSIPWSPKIQHIRNVIRYWTLILKKHNGQKIRTKTIKRVSRKIKIKYELVDKEKAKENLKSAWSEYKTMKGKAREMRDTHLEYLAEAMAQAKQTKTASILKCLSEQEKIRESYRRIKAATKVSAVREGLHTVNAPDGFGARMDCTTKQEVENACLNENARRFREACDTPFLVEPLLRDFGPTGDTQAADKVLEGTYHPPDSIPEATKKFLANLKLPEGIPEGRESSIPTSGWIEGWKKTKEQTSSSGRHYGHWKAQAQHNMLSQLNASIVSIAQKSGVVPKCWRTGTNVMLEKSQGIRDVEKMRIILLYDSEFNYSNKTTGRQITEFGTKHGLIAGEQYGSRPMHTANDQALNKRLQFDLWRCQRTTAALCSNDARRCYDRIVHSVASMAMRRMGVGKQATQTMLKAIQQLRHHIRTAYGDSDTFQEPKGTSDIVHGIGQGNGAGPAIWLAISTVLFDTLRNEGYGADICQAIDGDVKRAVGFAIVDDTDLIQDSPNDDILSVKTKMQEALDLWEGALRASGGALVPSKSFWYLVDFNFDKHGQWHYATIDDSPADIYMNNKDQVREKVERLEPHEARRTLGVRLAPDGNNNAQYDHMVKSAVSWAQKINGSHIKQHDVWTALQTTIIKTMEYPLRATTLKQRECDKIQTEYLRAALPNAGFPFTFPRDVLFGPKELGGLGIRRLYLTQGIDHIITMTYHGDARNITGQLIRAVIQAHKVEIGTGKSLFDNDWETIRHYITPTWISHNFQFMVDNKIHIDEPTPNLQMQCEGDQFIMDMLGAHRRTPKEWKQINMCRIYLRATTLADIVSGDGRRILKERLTGASRVSSPYKWPRQAKPPAAAWSTWRRAIHQACSDTNGTLQFPLGGWFNDTEHEFYFDSYNNHIYQRQDRVFKRYVKIGRSRSSAFIPEDATLNILVNTRSLVPAQCTVYANHIRLQGFRGWARQRHTQTSHDVQWSHFDKDSERCVASAIASNTAIAVTDGSFKNGWGTAAWILHDTSTGEELIGHGVTPGPVNCQSAYRAEVYGILQTLRSIDHICKKFNIHTGSITIACDCTSALENAFATWKLPHPNRAHYDLLSTIRQVISHLGITVKYKYVEGHQLEKGLDMDVWGELNFRADMLAKDRLRIAAERNDYVPGCPGARWNVTCKNLHLHGNMDKEIRFIIEGDKLKQFWAEKERCEQIQLRHIAWDARFRASASSSFYQQKFVVKMCTGTLPCGVTMKRYKFWDSAHCKRCERYVETPVHVFRCEATQARLQQDITRQRLLEAMKDSDTCPTIIKSFGREIKEWQMGNAFANLKRIQDPNREACEEQARLGWEKIWKGVLSEKWLWIQYEYWEDIGSKRSVSVWATKLVRTIWKIAWDLWRDRNDEVRKKTREEMAKLDSAVLNVLIRREKTKGKGGLQECMHHLLDVDMEDLFRRDQSYRAAWIYDVQSARS